MRVRRYPPTYDASNPRLEKPESRRDGSAPAKPPVAPKRKISAATRARILSQVQRVLELKSCGYTRSMIAREMGVNVKQVERWWERAFSEYIIDHRKLRDEKFVEILAGHEAMIRKWTPVADEADSKLAATAASIVLRARREISTMCGHGNTVAIEHSGAGGGPIVTVNATPMEHARAVREQFVTRQGGAIKVASDAASAHANGEAETSH